MESYHDIVWENLHFVGNEETIVSVGITWLDYSVMMIFRIVYLILNCNQLGSPGWWDASSFSFSCDVWLVSSGLISVTITFRNLKIKGSDVVTIRHKSIITFVGNLYDGWNFHPYLRSKDKRIVAQVLSPEEHHRGSRSQVLTKFISKKYIVAVVTIGLPIKGEKQ